MSNGTETPPAEDVEVAPAAEPEKASPEKIIEELLDKLDYEMPSHAEADELRKSVYERLGTEDPRVTAENERQAEAQRIFDEAQANTQPEPPAEPAPSPRDEPAANTPPS